VSIDPNPQTNVNLIEETRKQINRLFDEVAHLSEMDVQPQDYFGEFLKRALQGLAAPAGAVWIRTPQGHLQMQHQINIRQVGLDVETNRQSHDGLLRQAFQQARPLHIPPHSSTGQAEGGAPPPGNPSDSDVLLVPIVVEQTVTGLVEIWQTPGRNPQAIPGFLQFLARLAHFASLYMKNRQLRTIVGQQQLWTQLEAFARQVHNSLNPMEVGYMVVNEGRRLIECDRVSIGIRQGKKTRVEAISGADVVEKRSNLVQLMRTLMDEVLVWGEKLVYSGTKDDTLPPKVMDALDSYLAESNSKFLVALPLKDEREKESKKPSRSLLLMECFDPTGSADQLIARMEVVGKHAAPALYNAVEHRRIPMRFIWQPIAKVQEGLGGKAKAIWISVAAALFILLLAMIIVPYPLKMSAQGQLLPQVRNYLYPTNEGVVKDFGPGVEPASPVSEGQPLILMYDNTLEMKIVQLMRDIAEAQSGIDALFVQANQAKETSDRNKALAEKTQKEVQRTFKQKELEALKLRNNAEDLRPGYFWLKSPLTGTVLSWGFRENLINKFVKPSEPLLRVGDKEQAWEIELKIPQKHIGQILYAFDRDGKKEDLDVDLLLASAPTQTFKGKLNRKKIAGEATPAKDDPSETEPSVLAIVRIDGDDIPQGDRLPRHLLHTGIEVHTKVRCGNRAMGYSLFYGLWEFFYEKVVFFF
jgi:hypothetical protein